MRFAANLDVRRTDTRNSMLTQDQIESLKVGDPLIYLKMEIVGRQIEIEYFLKVIYDGKRGGNLCIKYQYEKNGRIRDVGVKCSPQHLFVSVEDVVAFEEDCRKSKKAWHEEQARILAIPRTNIEVHTYANAPSYDHFGDPID